MIEKWTLNSLGQISGETLGKGRKGERVEVGPCVECPVHTLVVGMGGEQD